MKYNFFYFIVLMILPCLSYAECNGEVIFNKDCNPQSQPKSEVDIVFQTKPDNLKHVNNKEFIKNKMHDAIKPDGKSFLPHNNLNTAPLLNTKSSLQTTAAHE